MEQGYCWRPAPCMIPHSIRRDSSTENIRHFFAERTSLAVAADVFAHGYEEQGAFCFGTPVERHLNFSFSVVCPCDFAFWWMISMPARFASIRLKSVGSFETAEVWARASEGRKSRRTVVEGRKDKRWQRTKERQNVGRT